MVVEGEVVRLMLALVLSSEQSVTPRDSQPGRQGTGLCRVLLL